MNKGGISKQPDKVEKRVDIFIMFRILVMLSSVGFFEA
jgi:hypothetical protein